MVLSPQDEGSKAGETKEPDRNANGAAFDNLVVSETAIGSHRRLLPSRGDRSVMRGRRRAPAPTRAALARARASRRGVALTLGL
jgi:hypothetical protein